MSIRVTAATAKRVLLQLRHDPRTIALLLVVPCVLVTLIKYVFSGSGVFDRIGGPLLGLFPLLSMFLVTSIAMLRERTTGTLERLLTMPLAKLDLLLGYAVAFAAMAVVQAVLVSAVAFGVLDLHVAGPKWLRPGGRGLHAPRTRPRGVHAQATHRLANERSQALVLFATGGAAVEVGAQTRDRGVRVSARELELDVPVEFVEAGVAADLGTCRAEEPAKRLLQIGSLHQFSSNHVSNARPRSCRCFRNLRRASCNVL
jgi:hypothetical protein